MKKNFNKAVELTANIAIILATIGAAILALIGLFGSIVWVAELCEGIPAILHNATAFIQDIEDLPGATWLPWEFVPTAFWAYPIKLQGVIIIFLGALSFLVLSYAGEWLNAIMKVIYPAPIAFANPKLQTVSKLVDLWWDMIINALRKLAVWIIVAIGATALLYITWNTLSSSFPM